MTIVSVAAPGAPGALAAAVIGIVQSASELNRWYAENREVLEGTQHVIVQAANQASAAINEIISWRPPPGQRLRRASPPVEDGNQAIINRPERPISKRLRSAYRAATRSYVRTSGRFRYSDNPIFRRNRRYRRRRFV